MNELKNLINQKLFDKNHLGNIDNLISLIEKYKQINPYDLDNFIFKCVYYYKTNNIYEAIKTAKEGLEKCEYNFRLNYYMAIFKLKCNDLNEALRYFCKCTFLTQNKESIDLCSREIDNILNNTNINEKEALTIIKEERNLFEYNFQNFPKTIEDNLTAKELIVNNIRYFVSCYDYYLAERDKIFLENVRGMEHFSKLEIFESKRLKSVELNFNEDTIIPIAIVDKDAITKIVCNEGEISLEGNLPNRYYYYKLRGKISIYGDKEFELGKGIQLTNNSKNKKLVLNIFIDGLSQKIIEENELEKVMPNTYRYFSKGVICNNAYSNGEWTLVSMASFFTSQYTANHGMYHPKFNKVLPIEIETLTEKFKNAGYFTAKIDGDYRSTPNQGYIRGVDRYVYQPPIRGMNLEEEITEAIEHIEAFKDTNKFLWITINELHDIPDLLERRLSCQINEKLELKGKLVQQSTSVRTEYDNRLKERYINQMKRVDIYLGLLFRYLEDNFKDEEILVSLVSDHGQGFLIEGNDTFLKEERTKVPFMFRGGNMKPGICNEFIEAVDLTNILLKVVDLKNNNLCDGNIPKYFGGKEERKFAFTESIFPGMKYTVAINDKEHQFIFESEENVEMDGRVNLDKYNYYFINKISNQKEYDISEEKVNEYINYVLDHIKYRRIY